MAELKITGRRRDEIRARMEAAPPAPWRYSNWVDFPIDAPGINCWEGQTAHEVGGPGVEFGHSESAVIKDRGAREFVIHSRQDLADALDDLDRANRQIDELLDLLDHIVALVVATRTDHLPHIRSAMAEIGASAQGAAAAMRASK